MLKAYCQYLYLTRVKKESIFWLNMARQTHKEKLEEEDEDSTWYSNYNWHHHNHHREHGGGFVLGAVLIIAGSLFLLNALGLVSWDIWNHIWAFWPVLLILFGLHIILDRDPILHTIMSVLTLVVLILVALYAYRTVNPSITPKIYPQINSVLNKMQQVDKMKGTQTHLRIVK